MLHCRYYRKQVMRTVDPVVTVGRVPHRGIVGKGKRGKQLGPTCTTTKLHQHN